VSSRNGTAIAIFYICTGAVVSSPNEAWMTLAAVTTDSVNTLGVISSTRLRDLLVDTLIVV